MEASSMDTNRRFGSSHGNFHSGFLYIFIFGNMERILVSWGSNIEMNIFLKDNLSPEQTANIKEELIDLKYFKEVQLITQKDAAEQFFQKCLSTSLISLAKRVSKYSSFKFRGFNASWRRFVIS